ncbi:MAG: DUF4031 domain-containing protein [Ilumatobacteraceae bacterium]
MAILVDECRWSFRDHVWCHMISDTSLDELHDFARELGISPRAFHGDHYDVPQHVRDDAIRRGARPVTSREVVRVLVSAGLRLTAVQRRAYTHVLP